MRIAFVVHLFPALSETFILNQITGLIKLGHEVDIYADSARKDPKVHADIEKYNLLARTYYRPRKPSNKLNLLLQTARLLGSYVWKDPQSLIKSLDVFKYGRKAVSLALMYDTFPFLSGQPYDIVHCHFGRSGLKAAFLREMGILQGKLVTTFYGFDINASPMIAGMDLYAFLFQRGDLFIVNSTFMAGKAARLGCPESRLIRLPLGLDLSLYSFKPRLLRANEPVKVLTVARLVEKKGLEYSIRAVASLVKTFPDIQYCIAGDGELRAPLEALIAELGMSGNIKLLGWKTQDEVRELYRDAHIFILSSVTAANGDQEGQGLVLQESQAEGLPVLSTLHNGIPDGVLDGKSGFLVPERDVDALAEKLRYLIEHPEVWAEMGRAGRTFVEENYNLQTLNDQLVEIYQQQLSGRPVVSRGRQPVT